MKNENENLMATTRYRRSKVDTLLISDVATDNFWKHLMFENITNTRATHDL